MRFQTHLITGVLTGMALYPRSPRQAAMVAFGGVALDIDHYLLYALRSGDWNPIGALRYNRRRMRPLRRGDTRPRYGSLRSMFHWPRLTLPLLALVSWLWPGLRPLAAGIALHLVLDTHLPHYDWRAWQRADGRCERCGKSDRPLEVYYVVPPHRGGPRFVLENHAVWCLECARAMWEAGYNQPDDDLKQAEVHAVN